MVWCLLPVTVGIEAVSAGWKEVPVLGGSHDYTGTHLSILISSITHSGDTWCHTKLFPRKQVIGNCHPTTHNLTWCSSPTSPPNTLPAPSTNQRPINRKTTRVFLLQYTRPAHCHAPDPVLDVSARWRGAGSSEREPIGFIFDLPRQNSTANHWKTSADGFAPRQIVPKNLHRPAGRSAPQIPVWAL